MPFRGDRDVVAGTVTNIFFLVKMTTNYVVYFKGVQIAKRSVNSCRLSSANSVTMWALLTITHSPTSTWNTDVAMRVSNVDDSETHR